jgi:predicted ATPase with chaperone activity
MLPVRVSILASPAPQCHTTPLWACVTFASIVSIDDVGERLLELAMQHFGLSARAHDRIRKVARTIADLDGAATITSAHLSEAIQYRTLDRQP